MTITKEFKKLTGFALHPRHTNNLSLHTERLDSLFTQLAHLHCSKPNSIKLLADKVGYWIKKSPSETLHALAGYVFYIREDFNTAKKHFLKTIALNPDNLDNWIDLAFCLRHLRDEKTSNGILFNYRIVIHYYKYLDLKVCGFIKLKTMIAEITKRVS